MNEELIQETQMLLSFESYSGQEKEVSDYLEILMQRLGFRDVFRDEYGSVFGFVGPKQNTTAILFDSHTDVMPVRGNWKYPPFGGEINDGKLYGRGSTDMKAFISVIISNMINLKSNFPICLSVTHEETCNIRLR